MTNTFKTIAVATLTAVTLVAGATSSNASGMNALASFNAETSVTKVGFFKKNGKFTNRGVAAIGVGAALVGGLLAKKAINKRNNGYRERDTYDAPANYKPRQPRRDRCRYIRPARGFTCRNGKIVRSMPRSFKPRYQQPRVQRPVIAFNQNVFNQQTWLNQLGFNAGLADGKMGRNTRSAAAQFQLSTGMPATGYLTPQQTGFLAQMAAQALAQRTNPYAVRHVASPQFAQPVAPAAPVAPVAYAPQRPVYAVQPTTQVFAQPQVQHYVPQQPAANGIRPIYYAPQPRY